MLKKNSLICAHRVDAFIFHKLNILWWWWWGKPTSEPYM